MLFLQVCKSNVNQVVDEDALGGLGYSEFFLACVSSLKQEELIVRSPKGRRVRVMLEAIEKIEREKIVDIATSLTASVHSCLTTGCGHKLPSAAASLNLVCLPQATLRSPGKGNLEHLCIEAHCYCSSERVSSNFAIAFRQSFETVTKEQSLCKET